MAAIGKVMITPKGNYDATVSYSKFDVVYHNGSSYMSLDNGLVGVAPGTDSTKWKLLVQGGLTYNLSNSSGSNLVLSGSDGSASTISDFILIKEIS